MERVGQTRKRPRRDWAAIIEAQSKSGQTAGIYCRERDIPYKSFLYNLRKARQREAASRSATCRKAPPSAFVPVRTPSTSYVVLRIPSGIVLECDRLPEVGWLIDLATGLDRRASSC
jgi:hypothetical protein